MNRLHSLFCGAAVAVAFGAGQADAAITCNLTDRQGHALQYSFTRGGDGYVNEIVVKRNGAVVSNGGPMWTRVSNKAQQSMTLRQGDWSIAYPWDSTRGASALRHNNNLVATGVCYADYSVDAPAPSIEASAPALAPTYTAPPAPTYQASNNAVSYTMDDGGGMIVAALLGDTLTNVLVDTGSSGSAVTERLASALLASGDAVDSGRTVPITMADGSVHEERIISIRSLQVGSHRLAGVVATVSPGATNIIGLSELQRLGTMTIDSANRQIVFG
jgi:predicted aspartyl protease